MYPQLSLPLSKHQSRLGLCVVVAGGGAANEHGGAAIPTQGVLQDAGHFAVTVWHVTFLRQREGEEGGWMRRRGGGREGGRENNKKGGRGKEDPDKKTIWDYSNRRNA